MPTAQAPPPLSRSFAASAAGLPGAIAVGYVVLYFVLDWVSYVHPMRDTNITPWNPQVALAVAVLTRSPRCWWLVGATLAAAALVRSPPAFLGAEVVASLMLTIGYAATAAALRRWLGALPRISTRKAYLVFLLIVAAGAGLNAGLYVGTIGTLGVPVSDRLLGAFLRGWIGDVVSLIVTLPLIYALADASRRTETSAMLRSVEWWLVAAASLVAAYAVFGRATEDQFKYFYLLFLPVAWGAARFGNVGATYSAAFVQVLLITAVQSSSYQPLTVFELHMLMAALGATGLLLGATVEERERAQQALRESLHVVAAGDMAAALAHELNQPLTAVRNYARASQLLAQRMDGVAEHDSASLAEATARLVDEANRAGDVVRRLRDFFRHRGTELQCQPLGPLIDDVLRSQAMRAASTSVTLESRCDESLAPIWMDRVQIEVVLRNLIANAIEAASEAPGRDAFVKVRAFEQDSELVVEVRDSGRGIAAEDVQTVFESRLSSKPGGMGIGLFISRSIVEAHEGRLWAEPGPGGAFLFSLPLPAGKDGE